MTKDRLMYPANMVPFIHAALEKTQDFLRMNNTSITVKESGKFVILEIEESKVVFLANFFYFLGGLHEQSKHSDES